MQASRVIFSTCLFKKLGLKQKIHKYIFEDKNAYIAIRVKNIIKNNFVICMFCAHFSTLPSIETPYPMLVLVGPQGSGKKDLAMKLVEEFSDYFGYG